MKGKVDIIMCLFAMQTAFMHKRTIDLRVVAIAYLIGQSPVNIQAKSLHCRQAQMVATVTNRLLFILCMVAVQIYFLTRPAI